MTLHTKYRPATFEEVRGQSEAVEQIKRALETGTTRAFLLHGPAGTGKTTLARIIARTFGADDFGIDEIDAATNTGVEAMRKIASTAYMKSLGGSGKRVYIVDECHMLSKNAWNSLLKIIEEPPEHVVWVFCTTEPHKVPKTIMTRCLTEELLQVPNSQIISLLAEVAEKEGMTVHEDVLRTIALMSFGSPRQALVNLGKVGNCDDPEKAESLMKQVEGEKEAYDLAKLIFSQQFTLKAAQTIIGNLKEKNPESVRIVVVAYATSVWIGARDAASAGWAARVLSAFETECLDQNRIGDIALRTARLLQMREQMKRA